MAQRNIQRSSQSRVFTLEGGAGPGTSAVYQGLGRAVTPDQAGGDVTPVRIASAKAYGLFDTVDTIVGIKGLPSMGIEVRKRRQLSEFMTLFQKECPVDVQLHIGSCTDPTDFQSFELIEVLEGGRITNYSTNDQGAFDGDQEASVVETLPFTGDAYYQIVPIRDSEIGESQIVQEIVGVVIPDSISCGDCGAPSDGSQVVFAVTKSNAGSPGLPAEVIATQDGGATLIESILDTIGADEDPTGLAAVGTDLVIISNADLALHYAPIADILAETETWTRVATGFVASNGPNAIYSSGRTFTWMAADNGYIYFTADITTGVTPQQSGSLTTENLNAIHGLDEDNVVAVGDNNAVLVTANGGDTWSAVTGPNVGVNLTTVWVRSALEWMVGDAGGNLWFTRDGGVSWTAKAFSGSGAGMVHAIAFATRTVGYMAHSTAASVGRVFRTVDGGATWFRIPTGGIQITAHDQINALAVADGAPDNVRANLVWAGGLADDATDGILLKFA